MPAQKYVQLKRGHQSRFMQPWEVRPVLRREMAQEEGKLIRMTVVPHDSRIEAWIPSDWLKEVSMEDAHD